MTMHNVGARGARNALALRDSANNRRLGVVNATINTDL